MQGSMKLSAAAALFVALASGRSAAGEVAVEASGFEIFISKPGLVIESTQASA